MPAPVKVVLTDLDDTLFDHHRATRAALTILSAAEPAFAHWTLDELHERHREQLDQLHVEVLAGRLSTDEARVERFRRLIIAASGADRSDHAIELAREYRAAYESSWHPVLGAMELLGAIKQRGLPIVVITNNQVLEQQQKLAQLRLTTYVDHLVTSEETGACKPAAKIFHAALDCTGAEASDAVMLGDAWATDIEGARQAGLRAVWLNRFGDVSPDASVAELTSLEPVAHALRRILNSEF